MVTKELIEGLCEKLEWRINLPLMQDLTKPRKKVDFVCNHFPKYNGFAFEATINIDRICVFREFYYYEDFNKESAESIVFERLLNNTFCYGVESAREILEQNLQPINNQ